MGEKKNEKRVYNKNFLDAWKNAINGIIYATTTQKNVQKQLIIIVVTIIASLFFDLTRVEFLCLVFSVVLIVIVEMINTAIETVVDLYTDLYHPKAKIAKDVGAGAVVLASINAVVVAYFLFFDKIANMGQNILNNLINSPVHLAFTAVVLTVIAIVAVKAMNIIRKKKGLESKFTPSGTSAISFAIAAVIWLNTQNMIATTLVIILALLLIISKVDYKERTWGEVIFGALLGITVTMLVYSLILLKFNI